MSFGLPSGGSGGYPISPFGPNPAVNAYGPSLGGGNGLNLGLVNVNPLLSLQVSKDEYGDKVVKPWVNLHVTPNHQLVDKVGYLFHKLKEPHYYDHPPPAYYHQHNHFHSPPVHAYGPPVKPIYERPHYSAPYAPHYHGGYNNLDYSPAAAYEDDYGDFDPAPYYRSANSSGDGDAGHYKRLSGPEPQGDAGGSSVVFPNDRSYEQRTKRQVPQYHQEEGGSAEQVNGHECLWLSGILYGPRWSMLKVYGSL